MGGGGNTGVPWADATLNWSRDIGHFFSGEVGRRREETAQRQMEERQRREAARQETALRQIPRRLEDDPLAERGARRRLRLGLASNIRTAGLGAPSLAPAALTGKALLGQ